MRSFVKTFFGSLLGTLAAFFVIAIIGMAIVAGIVSSARVMSEGSSTQYSVKPNSVLHLKFNSPIQEKRSGNPLRNIDLVNFEERKELVLNEIINAIEEAAEDENIKGIYIETPIFMGGLGTLEEVRQALKSFKESGKWVVSFANLYTQGAYYLASVSDEIYLFHEGAVDFRGLSLHRAYLKGLLDKLHIEPQIIRGKNNKYKSAVEPFFRDNMSDESRLQMTEFLEDLWGHLTQGIADSRDIEQYAINKVADSLLLINPEKAVQYQFVDKLMYRDEIMALLKVKLGVPLKDKISFVSPSKYFRQINTKDDVRTQLAARKKGKIGVVYAVGAIVDNSSEDEEISPARLAKTLRKLRKDSTIESVVLRVNSPGGSALGSEVIWREVDMIRKTKPIVVSMGDVAASGGYYIACSSNRIFAQPTTITGSIGVFGMMPNMGNFFKDKLGVTFDGVNTNANSDFGSVSRKLREKEMETIQKRVDNIYTTFKERVAEGRSMTVDQVENIAQGRVWSASDAKDVGLVDELGGLNDAIEHAASLAELEDYQIKEFPERKSPMEQIMKQLSEDVKMFFVEEELGEYTDFYKQLKTVMELEGIQARMPFFVEVK